MCPLTNSTRALLLSLCLSLVFSALRSRFSRTRCDPETMETERCWRGKRAALLLGAIRAFSAINNAECWASISQVGSVPARTLYTGREKERKSEELSSPRFSPPLASTMAKGPCLGLSGFHSHALDGERERERPREYGKTRTGAIVRVSAVMDVFIIC